MTSAIPPTHEAPVVDNPRVVTISHLLKALLMVSLSACAETATLPVEAGMGPNPTLHEPNPTLIPTINIAAVKKWPAGAAPTVKSGLAVSAYATGLAHPRWLYVLPNGDVLVAETNAPHKPEDGKGVTGWVMKKAMKRAGATAPTANRITGTSINLPTRALL